MRLVVKGGIDKDFPFVVNVTRAVMDASRILKNKWSLCVDLHENDDDRFFALGALHFRYGDNDWTKTICDYPGKKSNFDLVVYKHMLADRILSVSCTSYTLYLEVYIDNGLGKLDENVAASFSEMIRENLMNYGTRLAEYNEKSVPCNNGYPTELAMLSDIRFDNSGNS